MRRLAALVALCFLLPACPALANANVALDNAGRLQITGTDGNDNITVSAAAAGAVTSVTVRDAATILSAAGCNAIQGGTQVTCDNVAIVRADLLGGNDTFTTDQSVSPFNVPLELFGGDGDDRLVGGSANDLIFGLAGNDSISGGAGNDLLDGGEGNDVVNGNPGDDVAAGGNGRDTVSGGDDDDLVSGDEDDDDLHGNDGEDFVSGVGGGDDLDGGDGDDTLSGGEDNDRLIGGQGTDSMEGDEDIDTVTYADRSGPLTITVGNGLADDGAPGEGDEVGFSVENAIGGSGDDLIVGSSINNRLTGNAGNDLMGGGLGTDTLDAGAGDDLIDLRDDIQDFLSCGAGNDAVAADVVDDANADCESVQLPEPRVETPPAAAPDTGTPAPGTGDGTGIALLRPRVTPRVSIRIGPKRDRRAPYSYSLLGTVRVPAGGDAALACGDLALLSVEVKRGATTLLSLRPKLRRDCTFAANVTFKGPSRLRRSTRLRFTASFLGNAYLVPQRAKSVYARAG